MAQSVTPPWAKRLESKIDELIAREKPSENIEEKCYYHTKYGIETKKQCKPPCRYSLSLQLANNQPVPIIESSVQPTLSPVVNSILQYMRPMKFLSPIHDRNHRKKRKLEDDVVKINQ